MNINQFIHSPSKFLLSALLILSPTSGSVGGLMDVMTNPLGTLGAYVTQPSIDGLDSMLDARGRQLIIEARTQLDNSLTARLNDLDQWSKLTIADAASKIKLATNDAETNLERIIDERYAKFQQDLYDQQGAFKRNLVQTISLLQASLLVVAACSAVFACLVHFGFRIATNNKDKKINYRSSAIIIATIFIVMLASIKIGSWYIQRGAIKSERTELAKALAPNVRDFDLAAFRSKQILMLTPPDTKEEAREKINAEKYEIIQVFFNQRYSFSSQTNYLLFLSRVKSAIQNLWVAQKTIDKDLMSILAIITFDNQNRTRSDEFIGAQLAATALSTGASTPLWESTFKSPVESLILRYLTRPLTTEEMSEFFPYNAKTLQQNIPAIKIFSLSDFNNFTKQMKDMKDSLSISIRNHMLNTNSLYFRVIYWNLRTPFNGSEPRNGQQQLIKDIDDNRAAWLHILSSDAYKSASLAEKIKLSTIQYAVFTRLSDYKDSFIKNNLTQDVSSFTCKSDITHASRDNIRNAETRSEDRAIPEIGNPSTIVEETFDYLVKDGSLTALSSFAISRTLEDEANKSLPALYLMEKKLYTSIKKNGDFDINCDLLKDNYKCPPTKIIIPEPIFKTHLTFYKPVMECVPDDAKVKYNDETINSSRNDFLAYSAASGFVACGDYKCNSPLDYTPVFRLMQKRDYQSSSNTKTDEYYQLYSNARWAGSF